MSGPTSSVHLRWPLVAGAAAAALVVVVGVVAAVMLSRADNQSAVSYLGEGSPSGPGFCLLAVERGPAGLALGEWMSMVEAVEGVQSVERIEVLSGTGVLAAIGTPPITLEEGTRGVYFESERVGDAEHLVDEPGVAALTCMLTPGRMWVPDQPPAGAVVLAVSFDGRNAEAFHQRLGNLLVAGDVEAAEMLDDGLARILVDESNVDHVTAELMALDGIEQVAPESSDLQ